MIISKMTFTRAMEEFVRITENSVYSHIADIKITAYLSKEPLKWEDREKGKKVNLNIGDIWGDRYDCAWFLAEAEIPQNIDPEELFLIIDLSGEGCVFTDEGVPYRGLTTRCALYEQWIGKHHKKVCETAPFIKNNKLTMWIDCGANDMLGSCYDRGHLLEAYIGRKNESFYRLNYDIDVLLNLAENLYPDDPRKAQIEHALYEASKCVPTGANIRSGVNYMGSPDPTTEITQGTAEQAEKALKILKPYLNKKAGDTAITHHMVGHSHIDLAWLWPIRETKRKCQRTFSTVLRNMEKYSNYRFVQSQAQAYQWIKDEHPALFSQIKAKVKEGRWEANGGMWVEADGNLASGESFVRQFLYGKRFFRKELGEDCKVCHLPDTFGYNGALPQIIKEAGMEYFLFQKLMVNMYNKFPYNSFIWKGIDGSEILCHMPPCNTYQSNALPECNLRAERNYAEKAVSGHVLSLYGIGDGGSGPGEEHLERIERQKNLAGVGRNIMSSSIDFFRTLEKEKKNFSTWYGEMYLEFHQGTLTTQAKNKWFNRHIEIALRNLEILSVFAKIYKNIPYNKTKYEKIWKEVLLYQFHDILPGSSIKRVYDESIERYTLLYDRINSYISELLKKLACGKAYTFANTLGFDRKEIIKIDEKWTECTIPALSCISEECLRDVKKSVKVTAKTLENSLIKITFAENGSLEIYDKEEKRNVFASPSDRFVIYQDTTDAWDMYADYRERDCEFPKLSHLKLYSDGPVGVAEAEYTYRKSVIRKKIILKPDTKLTEIECTADWQENNKMLRVCFSPDIETDYTRSEIQFGNIKRNCKDFTEWDKAKYEICAHKWIDMSEKYYGVAILNDCKYGHCAKNNFISVNLLRSTSYPDPNADRGTHTFRYAILPHSGDYIEGKVIETAYAFNCPILAEKTETGIADTVKSFITLPDHLIPETIKEAEDSEDIIIRLYEAKEKTEISNIKFGIPVKKVYLTDILENIKKELPVKDNSIKIKTAPFKIYTLKLEK
ncbi:MAG: alpha-mannosidase [Armatimonadetes bacterium]|nr:alpha-mannosidase [Candidatus Hippobium faecium]